AHPLVAKGYAEPADLAGEPLITYPMDRPRLDVFSQFLDPAGVEPARVRQVEQTAIALMLIASGRGVAGAPAWVLRAAAGHRDLALSPVWPRGMLRRLLAALRREDLQALYTVHVLRRARTGPVRMVRALATGGCGAAGPDTPPASFQW